MDQNNNEGGVEDGSLTATPSVVPQPPVSGESSTSSDISKQSLANDNVKIFAILGYVLPFLFFLPLVNEATKNNQFSRFHANQQLILLILWVAVQVFADNFLYMIIGYGAHSLVGLLSIGVFVLAVIGIMNVMQNAMKELPFVGQFKILK